VYTIGGVKRIGSFGRVALPKPSSQQFKPVNKRATFISIDFLSYPLFLVHEHYEHYQDFSAYISISIALVRKAVA